MRKVEETEMWKGRRWRYETVKERKKENEG
jgi:hypothetical protein